MLTSGVTTSGSVTEVAGRGIGLDVVRATTQRLGGEVRMTTTPGRGTSFVLSFPPSAASLEALLVDVGGHTAAVPLASVRQVLKLAESDVAHAANGDNVIHDGGLLPLVPLGLPLRLPWGRGSPRARAGARLAIVVSAEGAPPVAFEVDGIAGVSTIVAQPLPHAMPVDPVVSGAALDGLGTPQLVLDPVQLIASARQAGPVAPPPEAPAPAPVLVVDDSLTTRMLEKSILETAGYSVDLATSAEEGLQRARQRRYGLFLVDVEMPGMDGFGFVSTIRADPVLRDTPAILVTSRDAAEDRQRGRDVGANGYVVKGAFDQSALLAMIAELVR